MRVNATSLGIHAGSGTVVPLPWLLIAFFVSATLGMVADETGLVIEVCHYPPGTSKWNKIEHRLFCHITRNWQGVPLETLEVVVESIGHTTTAAGLEVHAWLDEGTYEKGRKVSDAELAACKIKRHGFHGEWNYEMHPRTGS